MGTIDDVKARIDIVDLIGQRVPLKRSGKYFRGPCPFHGDRTPSFFVYPDDWHYHCFGCQAHGNGFDFVMATEHVEFREALKLLAERAGVTLDPPKRAAADNAEHARLRAINEAASLFFHNSLLNSVEASHAREYLEQRGISPSSIEQFQLGYAPESWDRLTNHLLERGYKTEEIVEAGLAIARDSGGVYDRFRNRLMFPIWDADGRVVGFGGRVLKAGDNPKYLNTPQTPIFDKSSILYGLNRAKQAIRQAGEVVIVEGYMDVVGVHQAGYRNAVATMGTALSPRHLQQLHRLAKRIVLALDPDAAGDEATLRNVELATEVLERREVPVPTAAGRIRFEQTIDADLRVARLPDGVDPDELVQQRPTEWQALIEGARPVVDFIFDAVLARLDTTKPEDRDLARQRLLPVVRDISDRLQRAHYLQRLSRIVQVDERVLRMEMGSATKRTKAAAEQTETEASTPSARPKLNQADAYALWLLLNHVQLWSRSDELDDAWLRDPDSRRILTEFREAGSPQMLRERLDSVGLVETLDSILNTERPAVDAEEIDEAWEETLARLRRRYLKERVDALGLFCQEAFREGDVERVAALGEEIQQLTAELLELDRSTRHPHRAAVST